MPFSKLVTTETLLFHKSGTLHFKSVFWLSFAVFYNTTDVSTGKNIIVWEEKSFLHELFAKHLHHRSDWWNFRASLTNSNHKEGFTV